jgi:hypothetical protein
MFNRDILNNEWLEAAKAYKDYQGCNLLLESLSPYGECSHPEAKRNKDGSRDKRSWCFSCEKDMHAAQDRANSLSYEWQRVWVLFERIGMPVREALTASLRL